MLAVFGVRREADRLTADAASNDVLQTHKGAAANEENVAGIDLNILLFGMLAAALGRHVADGPFKHLEKRLLHAFAGDVAGDADILAGLGNLVDFIDIDDAALG